MDINTRLDGFIIHPLDAFNDKHHEESIPKFSNTAPNLDGFQVHPLDNFISQEHNNNIFNDNVLNQTNDIFSNNETFETGNNQYNNIYNYNDTNQTNNIFSNNEVYETGNNQYNNIYNYNDTNQTNNIFSNNEVYETVNTFNLDNNISNYGFDQTPIQDNSFTTPVNNNDYNYNQYETSNITSQIYPVSYTEPTANYNYDYLNNNSSNITPLNQESNYINITTPSYANYSTSTFNYSKVLPTKYLPTIEKTNKVNSISPISVVPKISKVIYTIPSTITPSKSVYTVPSYKTYTEKKFINTTQFSQISPIPTVSYNNSLYSFNHFRNNSYNVNSFIYKPKITHYKTNSVILPPKVYRITSYTPEIKWKKILPKRTTIVIPTVKKFIIPRRTKYILPKKQSIIIPNSVIVKPMQVSNIYSPYPKDSIRKVVTNPPILSTLPKSFIVPTITVPNQSVVKVNLNGMEKFPMDNRRRITTIYNMNMPKGYYFRDLERVRKKKNF